MNFDLKKIISPAISCLAGLLGFILLALNSMTIFVTYFGFSFENSIKTGSSYSVLGKNGGNANAQFFLTLSDIMVVCIMILSVVLLAAGVVKILMALGVDLGVIEQYESLINTVNSISLLANLGACVANFFFLLLYGICNITEYSVILPGIGPVLMCVFSLIAFVAYIYVVRIVEDTNDAPKTIRACTSCGKRVGAGVNFCPACGGVVEEKIQYPTVHVCSSCGCKARANDKFCSKCGGAIVEKQIEQ